MSETVHSLADMPDLEYDLYVAPALNAAKSARDELDRMKRDFALFIGAICEKYGDKGRISIPARALLRPGGTLYREERMTNGEIVFFVAASESEPRGANEA